MREFCCENDFPAGIIDQGNASGLTARVKLDAQRLKPWGFYGNLEYDREREPFEHCRLPGREQEARIARMHRVEWLSVGIDDEYFGHWWLLLSEPLIAQVMVALTRFRNGLTCRTPSKPSFSFNPAP
jgi:hypothetical protein